LGSISFVVSERKILKTFLFHMLYVPMLNFVLQLRSSWISSIICELYLKPFINSLALIKFVVSEKKLPVFIYFSMGSYVKYPLVYSVKLCKVVATTLDFQLKQNSWILCRFIKRKFQWSSPPNGFVAFEMNFEMFSS
jgi:hypothetical protein